VVRRRVTKQKLGMKRRKNRPGRLFSMEEHLAFFPACPSRNVEIEPREPRDCSGSSERPQLLVRPRLVTASWVVPAETSAARMGYVVLHNSVSCDGFHGISQ